MQATDRFEDPQAPSRAEIESLLPWTTSIVRAGDTAYGFSLGFDKQKNNISEGFYVTLRRINRPDGGQNISYRPSYRNGKLCGNGVKGENGSINQSINQSIKSINQSINHSVNR